MAKKLKDDVVSNSNAEALAACLAWQVESEVEQQRLNAKKAARWRAFESEGIDKKAAKKMHALSKLDDDEFEARVATEARYLRLTFDWSADGQGDFAEAMTRNVVKTPSAVSSPNELKLRAARAHADGYNTGKAGGLISNCKFPPGSEEFVSWRDGWDDGASDRKLLGKEKKKAKDEKAATPRVRKSAPAKKNPAKPDVVADTLAKLDTAGNA